VEPAFFGDETSIDERNDRCSKWDRTRAIPTPQFVYSRPMFGTYEPCRETSGLFRGAPRKNANVRDKLGFGKTDSGP
jgi:urease alpha subunit